MLPRILPILFACAMLSRAAFLPIAIPDPAYTSRTFLVELPAPWPEPIFTSIESQGLTITLSQAHYTDPLNVGPAGWNGFQYWLEPPAIEPVLGNPLGMNIDSTGTDYRFDFSQPLYTFGFEAAPYRAGDATITVEFLSGSGVVGTISRTTSQFHPLLFAASTSQPFTAVHITSSNEGGPVYARLRYEAVPEPAGFLLAGAGLLGLLLVRRYTGTD